MATRRTRSRSERGHTLLELTVAATLVAVLGVVFGMAGRFTSGETLRTRQRARAAGELHAVVEHLRQDLARAAVLEIEGSGALTITPERPIDGLEHNRDWSAADGLEYSLAEGKLYRTVLPHRESSVVAVGIEEFELTQPDGETTYVRIAAGEGLLRRQVTLVWGP
ncbi:MAG: hypothetical protein QNJ90_12665 [Planctomycetota bacterium]|nr:hypothetical protein [Planctomycetota bacterium]